jgi:hypothetical protein
MSSCFRRNANENGADVKEKPCFLCSDTKSRRFTKSSYLKSKDVASKCMNYVIFIIRDTVFVDLFADIRRDIGCHSADVH